MIIICSAMEGCFPNKIIYYCERDLSSADNEEEKLLMWY